MFYLFILAFTRAYKLSAYIWFWKTAKKGFITLGALSVIQIFKALPPTKLGLNSIFTRRIRKLSLLCMFQKELIGF